MNPDRKAIEQKLYALIGEDTLEQDSWQVVKNQLKAELRTKVPETAKLIVSELKGVE